MIATSELFPSGAARRWSPAERPVLAGFAPRRCSAPARVCADRLAQGGGLRSGGAGAFRVRALRRALGARSPTKRASLLSPRRPAGAPNTLHILINNAVGRTGANRSKPASWKAWDRVLSVNVTGLFTLTRDLAPMLIASATHDWPSTVVNMGSVMGTVTQSETAWAYSASKAAVHHLDPHPRCGACGEAGDRERVRAWTVFRPT